MSRGIDPSGAADADGKWANKYVAGHVDEVENVTWVADDGLRYLRPEIVLVYKARLRRPKDDPDFEATLPTLTTDQRTWMKTALEVLVPDHHWLPLL